MKVLKHASDVLGRPDRKLSIMDSICFAYCNNKDFMFIYAEYGYKHYFNFYCSFYYLDFQSLYNEYFSLKIAADLCAREKDWVCVHAGDWYNNMHGDTPYIPGVVLVRTNQDILDMRKSEYIIEEYDEQKRIEELKNELIKYLSPEELEMLDEEISCKISQLSFPGVNHETIEFKRSL